MRGLVTVSHCSDEMFELDEGPLYQPASSRQVGTEHTDPHGSACGLGGFDECRDSDASFYSIASGIHNHRGLIARTQSRAGPGGGYGSILFNSNRPYFLVTSVDDEDGFSGQYVQKMGSVSGWTYGQIDGTCTDHRHDDWPNSEITQCTYEANFTNADGDSGGPVFSFEGTAYDENADLVRLMGLVLGHVDGIAVFSKWGRVVNDLGALDVVRTPSLSTPSISGSLPFLNPVISWSSISGATRYNVFRGAYFIGSTTSTSFTDASIGALEYTGSTQPSNGAFYTVHAVSATELSAKSTGIWFRAAASGQLTVTITGPSVVGPNNYTCSTWAASVSGGSTIVSYAWSGFFTSSEGYVQGTIPQTGAQFQVVVVDDQDRHGGALKSVTYDPNNQDSCEDSDG